MTQDELETIRLIVREEIKRYNARERQRRCRAKKKAGCHTPVTHVTEPVTLSPRVMSRSITIGHTPVTKNGSSPSSPPHSPSHTLPLSPPLTPPTPKKSSSYATHKRVEEWCAKKNFKVMIDFAWGKIRLYERFNPPITNESDFRAEMFNIKSMWLKEKE